MTELKAVLPMYSKQFVYLLVLLVSVGCSLKTNDKGEPKDPAQFSNDSFKCLSNFSKEIDRYLNGKMQPSDIESFSGCLKEALHTFAYRTKGSDQKGYKPQEIADFLNNYLTPDNKIKPNLLKEVIRIKVLISGGSADFVTHSEYKRLIEIIDQLKTEALRHNSSILLYGLADEQVPLNIAHEKVNEAQSALRKTALTLAQILSSSNVSYRLSDLKNLIDEVRLFLSWNKKRKSITNSSSLIEVAKAYKHLIIGQSSDEILPTSWEKLLSSSADIFGQYIQFKHQIINQKNLSGTDLDNFISFAEKSFSILENAMGSHKNKEIQVQVILDLVTALDKASLLQANIRSESLRPVIELLIAKVLRDPSAGWVTKNEISLGGSELAEARKEFYVWADSQRFISNKYGMAQNSKLSSLNLDLSPEFNLTGEDADQQAQHILQIIKEVRPLFRNNDSRVWLIPKNQLVKYDVKYNLDNLTRLNLFGSLMRILIRGFATGDRAIKMTGITIDEMEKFFEVLRPLAADIQLLDPRSQRVGIRSFREGNMFTFSGNGLQPFAKDEKSLLTFTEGIELLAFIWSAASIRTDIYKYSIKKCEESNPPLDIFKNKKIDRKCFLDHFSDNQFSEISNIPNMRSYVLSLKGDEKVKFYSNLEEISKAKCENPNFIDKNEIAIMTTILHYTEVLFAIYDRNQDGILNGYEVMASFPRFHYFLGEKVEEVKKKKYDIAMLKGIFTFLVKEGRFPDGFFDKADIIINRYSYYDKDPEQYVFSRLDQIKPNEWPSVPVMRLDRVGLIKVLSMLNKATSKAACK